MLSFDFTVGLIQDYLKIKQLRIYNLYLISNQRYHKLYTYT